MPLVAEGIILRPTENGGSFFDYANCDGGRNKKRETAIANCKEKLMWSRCALFRRSAATTESLVYWHKS